MPFTNCFAVALRDCGTAAYVLAAHNFTKIVSFWKSSYHGNGSRNLEKSSEIMNPVGGN